MWKRVVIYGLLLGAGTLALQGLEYQRLARVHTGDVYIFSVALAFLVLGVVVGMRLTRRAPPAALDNGNPPPGIPTKRPRPGCMSHPTP